MIPIDTNERVCVFNAKLKSRNEGFCVGKLPMKLRLKTFLTPKLIHLIHLNDERLMELMFNLAAWIHFHGNLLLTA